MTEGGERSWPGKEYGWPSPYAADYHTSDGQTDAAEGDDTPPRFADRTVAGEAFLFDVPEYPEPVWGDGAEILWSRGEPCLITGPVGAGKTTLMGRLVHASLGISREVLGFSVSPAKKILYLACDRPQQIARNLRRMFDQEADGATLHERLIVWPGPPPKDLSANPYLLCEMAQAAGADRVFIDGIKDIAFKVSEEETGQGLNAEFQRLVVAGIDVVANHHQRKGEGGRIRHKPKGLEDMYGSTWLAAGAGTVILCWADEAGSPVIEVSTLKSAAETVGPIEVIHNLEHGSLDVEAVKTGGRQRITLVNVETTLRAWAHTTRTAAEIAIALGYLSPEKYEVQRCRQQAQKLVDQSLASVTEFGGQGTPEQHFKWSGG